MGTHNVPHSDGCSMVDFSHSELAGDVRLYREIYMMLGPELRDPRPRERELFSMGVLRAVSNKLGRESAEVMAAYFAALDAIDAVGQPRTTTSTSTKGNGKGSGNGKQ